MSDLSAIKLNGTTYTLSDDYARDSMAKIEYGILATKAYAVGDYLINNNHLYRVTSAIATGVKFTVGTNIELVKLTDDVKLKAPLESPNFTGTPKAPTASTGTKTTQIASTAYVQNEIDIVKNNVQSTIDYVQNELGGVLTSLRGDLNSLDSEVDTISDDVDSLDSAVDILTRQGTTLRNDGIVVCNAVDGGDNVFFMIDDTLTEAHKAADAKATGNAIGELKENLNNHIHDASGYLPTKEPVIFTSGAYIKTGNINIGSVVNLTPVSYNASYAIVDCTENDIFAVKLTGGAAARGWAFIDADNKLLVNSASGAIDTTITAPGGAVKAIFNSTSGTPEVTKTNYNNGFSILQNKVAALETETENISINISDVYEFLTPISSVETIVFTSGAYIRTGNIGAEGTTVNINPVSSAGYRYAIVSCASGDIFQVDLTGGNSARAWAFIDSNNALISNSASGAISTAITAPANAAYVIFNDNSNGSVTKNTGSFFDLVEKVDNFTKFVSASGNDNNDGNTPSSAYKSIYKALREGARTVYIATGTYTEAQEIIYSQYLYKDVTIYADNAVLNTNNGLHFRFCNVNISGLTVILDGTNTNASGFFLLHCTGRIADCKAQNAPQMGFRLDSSCMTLERCEAFGCGIDGFNAHNVSGVADCTFINCYGHDNGDDGLSLHEDCKMQVIGGEYSNNAQTGIAPHNYCDFELIGAYCHNNGTSGIEALNPSYEEGEEKGNGRILNCISNNNETYGINAGNYNVIVLNTTANGNSSSAVNRGAGATIDILAPLTS